MNKRACFLVCSWIVSGAFLAAVGVPGHSGVAQAAAPAGTVPVHRFMSNANNEMHVYTIDAAEVAKLTSTLAWAYTDEGIAYYAPDGSDSRAVPVYRFWSKITGAHFFTISVAEKNKIETQLAYAWASEGPVFYAYPEGSQPAGTSPVYRFWSAAAGCHFFTMSTTERDKLKTTYAYRWSDEGIAWYAYPASSEPVNPPSGGTTISGRAGLGAAQASVTNVSKLFVVAFEPVYDAGWHIVGMKNAHYSSLSGWRAVTDPFGWGMVMSYDADWSVGGLTPSTGYIVNLFYDANGNGAFDMGAALGAGEFLAARSGQDPSQTITAPTTGIYLYYDPPWPNALP